MARKRSRAKGRLEKGPFFVVPNAVVEHPKYARLKPRAVKLLIDVYSQYNGHNNGDFTAAFSVMRKRGWSSKDQLRKALLELLEVGYLKQTRQGGKHQCSLFAVTFRPIDECKGKLDIAPTQVAPGDWKREIESPAP